MSSDHANALPPQAIVMRMLMGKYVSKGVSICAELQIPDLVGDETVSTDVLAEKSGTHPNALYRILRSLAAVGIFEEAPDRCFRNNAASSVLRSDAPGSLRALARLEGSDLYWRLTNEMSHSLETGEPAMKKLYPGENAFNVLSRDQHLQQVFQEAMSGLSNESGRAVAQSYDFTTFGHIVDVGGGYGTMAMFIKERARDTRLTLLDLPHVIERAEKVLAEAGMSDQIETVGGNFFEQVPPAEAYIMKFILHDWPDEDCVRLLTNCRESLEGAGGKVLVCEMIVDDQPHSSIAKFLDIGMMLGPGGRERTEEEFAALFARAGLKLERVVPTPSPFKILEALPE